ncbi:MAG TPA: hypothetical protein VGJ05_07355 [Fimbriiglobus sp.]|jgi:hypothetical protein
MPTPVVCPSCGSSLDIPAELFGGPVRCANCSTVFTAPAGSTGERTGPPADRFPDRPRKRSRSGCVWGILAVTLLSGFCCCGGCFALVNYIDNPNFQPYTAPDKSYTVSFPGTPTPLNRFGPTGRKVEGAECRRDFPKERYFVQYATLTPAEFKEGDQKLLNATCDAWLATVAGGKEDRRQMRDVDGNPAIDLFIDTGVFGMNNLYVRIMKVGNRIYSIGIDGQIRPENKHGDAFLDSFQPAKK